MSQPAASSSYPAFDRQHLGDEHGFGVIGTGELGGKAVGLASVRHILADCCPLDAFPDVSVSIPRLTVVATDVFEQFMSHNNLWELATADVPDSHIALAFQRAELPPLVTGDLRTLATRLHTPLAIRSSSLLEDKLNHPFAGTYATKMIPNNQGDVATRFHRLVEAIKLVWASTLFRDARLYRRAAGRDDTDERMAVIIQEVVGLPHGPRYYPDVSGVIRTHNFYPTGSAQASDGVVALALGLGKTIVDGGVVWSYSPALPTAPPPYGSARELLNKTQAQFWAVNVGPPPPYDPISESEYLVQADLTAAEADGVLHRLVSTYDPVGDRLNLGTGYTGPRVLTFAPLLELNEPPLNDVAAKLAAVCKQALHADVEIEFAMTCGTGTQRAWKTAPAAAAPNRFGFLQVRPMLVSSERVEVAPAELKQPAAVVASETVLGNGVRTDLADVVYVKPATFDARHTRTIARELDGLMPPLVADGRVCVLIGFGRWGSSDPWLGIPVTWPQISAARVIVEATLPDMNVEASQGAHLFHNMTSFRVHYYTVRHTGPDRIDWDWLAAQPVVSETQFVRHVRPVGPLTSRVDGRTGRGVLLHP